MIIVSEKNGTIERDISESIAHARFEDYCSYADHNVTGDLYLFKESRIVKEWDGETIIINEDD